MCEIFQIMSDVQSYAATVAAWGLNEFWNSVGAGARTSKRIGRSPKKTSRSNNDWWRPAFAAALHMTWCE